MNIRQVRRGVVGVGMALAILGVGATSYVHAASPASANGVESFVADVAHHLGVTPSALTQAIRAAQLDRVHQWQKSGKISSAEAAKLEQRIVSGKMSPGFGFGEPGHHRAMKGKLVQAAAKYVGISPADFRQALHRGQSPAQIAQAHGKSAAGLKQALMQDVKTRLDAAVKAGKLTQAQEQNILAKAGPRLDHWVNHAPKAKPSKAPAAPSPGR